jgi:hypothetical protein
MTSSVFLLSLLLPFLYPAGPASPQDSLTYNLDIAPIINTYCLPCHLADSENPSGLSLDDYASLMEGGEHGDIIIPGKPEESVLYLKLQEKPPFGKRMPRNRKELRPEEIRKIRLWIEQGGKE